METTAALQDAQQEEYLDQKQAQLCTMHSKDFHANVVQPKILIKSEIL